MTQLEIIITVIALLGLSIICILLIISKFMHKSQTKNRYNAWESQFKTQCNTNTRRSKPTILPKGSELDDAALAILLRTMKGNDT